MATELHDGDLFSDFVLLAAEVVGDGQMRPRARDAFPLELVETVGARVVARHDLDSLQMPSGSHTCQQTSSHSSCIKATWWKRWGGEKCVVRVRVMKKGEEGDWCATHDFDAILREIPAFVDGTMLSLAHGGSAEVMI